MNCEEAINLMDGYLDGELDPITNQEIERHLPLRGPIHLTGGAVSPALIRAKQKWMRAGDYVHEEESSVKGAALLALLYLAHQ